MKQQNPNGYTRPFPKETQCHVFLYCLTWSCVRTKLYPLSKQITEHWQEHTTIVLIILLRQILGHPINLQLLSNIPSPFFISFHSQTRYLSTCSKYLQCGTRTSFLKRWSFSNGAATLNAWIGDWWGQGIRYNRGSFVKVNIDLCFTRLDS